MVGQFAWLDEVTNIHLFILQVFEGHGEVAALDSVVYVERCLLFWVDGFFNELVHPLLVLKLMCKDKSSSSKFLPVVVFSDLFRPVEAELDRSSYEHG